MQYRVELTRLAPALRTAQVEMAYNPLTTGASHLVNLGSPFLDSWKAWDCLWNRARTASGDSHLSIAAARGWLRRSCPVRLVYWAKAASKMALRLDGAEVETDDIV